MRTCLVLCVATALVGAARAECDACIDRRCYRTHRLPKATCRLNDIHRNTSTLYCMNTEGSCMLQCNLDNAKCHNLTHMNNIWSLAVDQRTGDTYGIWIIEKIYKLDLINSDNMFLLFDINIRHIKFKDKLYYTARVGGIYTFEDGESRVVAGTQKYNIGRFIVDKSNDIYFVEYNNYPPVIRRWSGGAVNESEYWYTYYFMTQDRDDNIMFFHTETHAIYRVTNGQLIEVGAHKYSIKYDKDFAILFDRNNDIIYAFDNSLELYHLKKESNAHCTTSAGKYSRIITEVDVSTERDNSLSSTPEYTESKRWYPNGLTQNSSSVVSGLVMLTLLSLLLVALWSGLPPSLYYG